MCVLLGYGADAICPYLVFEMARSLRNEGVLESSLTDAALFQVCIFLCFTITKVKLNLMQ